MSNMFFELSNGVKIPKIGFGVDTLKGDVVTKSVIEAIKAGYRMIDTASLYRNEKEVGEAIRYCINHGIVTREELFISTKAPYFHPGYDETLKGYEESLNKLGLDYVDLYLLHHPYREYSTWQKEIVSSWRAMEKLYKEGKVKAIGVCNFSWPFFDVLFNCGEIMPMVNQIEVHPQHQYKEVVSTCKERNIQVVAWSVLNKGRIVNEPIIQKVAEKYNKTPAQIAIRWNIQKENAILVRSIKPERIIANKEVYDFNLTDEDMKLVDSISPDNFFRGHEANCRAVGTLSVSEFNALTENRENYIKTFKLFGFIPFLKEQKFNKGKIKWYLFGIPILKIKTK